jgi:hypothetical protein
MRRTLPRDYTNEYSQSPEKDDADGHKRAGDDAVQVRGALALGFRNPQAWNFVVLNLYRAQVRAAPWIARREPHNGGEKGRAEGTHRQPVMASPTPSTVPRAITGPLQIRVFKGGD